MSEGLSVSAVAGVYRVHIDHEDIGTLWALAYIQDEEFGVNISYRRKQDDFELSGGYNTLTLLASELMRSGEHTQRLRYVNLAVLILNSLEDSIEDIIENAQWN